jgi:hypothetical protein
MSEIVILCAFVGRPYEESISLNFQIFKYESFSLVMLNIFSNTLENLEKKQFSFEDGSRSNKENISVKKFMK